MNMYILYSDSSVTRKIRQWLSKKSSRLYKWVPNSHFILSTHRPYLLLIHFLNLENSWYTYMYVHIHIQLLQTHRPSLQLHCPHTRVPRPLHSGSSGDWWENQQYYIIHCVYILYPSYRMAWNIGREVNLADWWMYERTAKSNSVYARARSAWSR